MLLIIIFLSDMMFIYLIDLMIIIDINEIIKIHDDINVIFN